MSSSAAALPFEIVSVRDTDRKIILHTKNPCRKILITAEVRIADCVAAECYESDINDKYLPFLHRPQNLRDLVGHSLKYVQTAQEECTQYDLDLPSPHTKQVACATVTIATDQLVCRLCCNEEVPLMYDDLESTVAARAQVLEAYEYPPASLHIVAFQPGGGENEANQKVQQLLAQIPDATKWEGRGSSGITYAMALKSEIVDYQKKVILAMGWFMDNKWEADNNDAIVDATDRGELLHKRIYNSFIIREFNIINPETAIVVHWVGMGADDEDAKTI